MLVTLGQQYTAEEKPTVIMYTYINRHTGPPVMIYDYSAIEPYKKRGCFSHSAYWCQPGKTTLHGHCGTTVSCLYRAAVYPVGGVYGAFHKPGGCAVSRLSNFPAQVLGKPCVRPVQVLYLGI